MYLFLQCFRWFLEISASRYSLRVDFYGVACLKRRRQSPSASCARTRCLRCHLLRVLGVLGVCSSLRSELKCPVLGVVFAALTVSCLQTQLNQATHVSHIHDYPKYLLNKLLQRRSSFFPFFEHKSHKNLI